MFLQRDLLVNFNAEVEALNELGMLDLGPMPDKRLPAEYRMLPKLVVILHEVYQSYE